MCKTGQFTRIAENVVQLSNELRDHTAGNNYIESADVRSPKRLDAFRAFSVEV